MVYLSICLYHLWFLSSVSYNFLSTGLLPPWVGFFLGIFFIAMVNEIVSLIYLSDLSLLMYRNAEDFCPLIFYPENLSYSLVRTSHFNYIYIYYFLPSIHFEVIFLLSLGSWEGHLDCWIETFHLFSCMHFML